MPGNFLFVDRRNLADAMRRIDDEFAGLETVTLRGFFLLGCHTPATPVLRPAALAMLDYRDVAGKGRARLWKDRQPGAASSTYGIQSPVQIALSRILSFICR
jgi:hypothetical protein